MRTVFALSLVGSLAIVACGGARAPTVPVGTAPARTAVAEPSSQAIAEPRTQPRPPPGRQLPIGVRSLPDLVSRDGRPRADGIVIHDDVVDAVPPWLRGVDPSPDRKSFAKNEFWSPCIRDFVHTQPEAARMALGEALSLYSTTCTGGAARRIEFRTPRIGRLPPAQSHLGLVGALERTTCEASLVAAYRGAPIHAERITLIADGARWTSPRIAFDSDADWETATIPLTRSLAREVQRAIAARDAVLRFEGPQGYEDVVVSDEMKQDLRAMLDALDAINQP